MDAKKHLLTGELIGLQLRVARSKNRSLEGIQGQVIDETKNTLTVKTVDGKTKKIIKDQSTFTVKKDGKEVKIEGSLLSAKPEERTKKWLRKKIR